MVCIGVKNSRQLENSEQLFEITGFYFCFEQFRTISGTCCDFCQIVKNYEKMSTHKFDIEKFNS